jgi:glutathione S-transferase
VSLIFRDPISIEEARKRTGLRLLLLQGLPSPWSQAAKGIFHVKGIDYALVHCSESDPPGILEEWTGQASYPVAMLDDEQPRSGWAEILLLAERLAPQPALLPADPAERAQCLGLCFEVCGEMGLGWCRRLESIHAGMQAERPGGVAKYLGDKYGYTPESGAQAAGRVSAVLGVLADRLEAEQARGNRFLLGPSLSALDIYWATFCNLVSPLPLELLPMPEPMRPMFTSGDPAVVKLLDRGLLAHRDFVYREFLELPVVL